MADHDQRFKILLQEFFAEFFQLFFPQWAERFEFPQVEWLDMEVFSDPPQGERLVLDLAAQLPTRKEVPAQRSGELDSWIALVHVEVEQRTSAAGLRPRMFDYYQQLRQRHRKPVLPIGLYLQVGLDGVGVDVYEEQFWDFRPLWFQYLYVGLPALDARTYLTGDNWLGVALAALMKIPEEQKALFKAEAWRRLVQCPENQYRKFLLVECVDAYLPLGPAQQQTFEELVTSEPYQGARSMVMSMYEQMVEKERSKVMSMYEQMLQQERSKVTSMFEQMLQQERTLYEQMREQERSLYKQVREQERSLYEQRQKKERLELIQMQLEARFGPLSAQVRERLISFTPDQLVPLFRGIVTASSLHDLGLED